MVLGSLSLHRLSFQRHTNEAWSKVSFEHLETMAKDRECVILSVDGCSGSPDDLLSRLTPTLSVVSGVFLRGNGGDISLFDECVSGTEEMDALTPALICSGVVSPSLMLHSSLSLHL